MRTFRYSTNRRDKRLLQKQSVRRRMQNELREAIKWDLTDKQRETVLLYYTQNLTMREIARRQNVCVSTVSRSLDRARMRIDRRLNSVMEDIKKEEYEK